jgi:hypothetical protein
MQPTERLLELVGLAHPDPEPLVAFAGVQGTAEQGLVVVGRAPEGGSTVFEADKVRTPHGRAQVLSALRKERPERGDLSTPFWETARAVALLREDGEPGDDWAEKIGWTHLYRIAPQNGSLSTELRTLQQALCAQLFWREILIWRPRRVLFMTGLEWAAPFVFAHHSSELEARPDGTYVRGLGALRLQGAKTPAMVVVDPPDPEEASSEDRMEEIGEAFTILGS